ncbi:two pore domain potassium channel family protein [Pseudomonas sp. SWRI51]|uniref:potassium channel family protein n=1 Tax=Pseudomonas sp. SWRI51 TaxID=2745491 RepID=UPI001648B701|nr:potassium channel family protein [Pseudomonas sp. SWRI51]MBC3410484.1 two pore domain potassium channel family protein [Pseudomonas sp. SWRI51]
MNTTSDPEKKVFMDRLAERTKDHPWWSVAVLMLCIAATFWVVHCAPWHWALVAIVVFYAAFTFVIFCTSRPRGWEGSILFLTFIMAAVLFIALFGFVYKTGNLIVFEHCCTLENSVQECTTNTEAWNWYYYSTVVFTTLGFGDVTPTLFAGKVVTSVEALLGMAYGVTAVITFLGRHSWLNAQGSADDKQASPAASPCRSADPQLISLVGAVAAQSHDLANLREQFATHLMETAIKLKHLKYALWITWGLLAMLTIIFVSWQLH